ncbi:MAG: putative GTP-binding protein EngB [bacterium]|nr:MAG: putative GTP-binding protein EngB [bacterium]
MKIISSEFIKPAFNKNEWPESRLPEIAFAGRSNVGKSSIINSLLRRKSLVKTSSTPGKTRSINFFMINKNFVFTDLPGYGYASGNKKEISGWKKMIEEYLLKRESLRALVHIVDIRRKPDDLEKMLLEWAQLNNIEHLLVASKCDKLSKSRCAMSANDMYKILGKKPILFSITAKTGNKELWKILTRYL